MQRNEGETGAAPDGEPRSGPESLRASRGSAGASPGDGLSVRASDSERDAVLQRLRDAFADGRLDDGEFDERARSALTARTHGELDKLLSDLPADQPATALATATGRPGKFAIAWKGLVRRSGRWRVPERYTTVVYKGSGLLDLRVAELAGPVTSITAVAYKSTITIVAPPGVRVEMTGFGVVQSDDETDVRLPANAPVVQVRALAYKGTVEVAARPPARPTIR